MFAGAVLVQGMLAGLTVPHQLVAQLQQLGLGRLGAVERVAGNQALLLQHLLHIVIVAEAQI